METRLSGDAESGTEDIWVMFYDDDGKELSFGNVGKVTDFISRWRTWRANRKSKQPYLDGIGKFLIVPDYNHRPDRLYPRVIVHISHIIMVYYLKN